MFAPTPLRRTLDAALRDLASKRADVRVSAARDLSLAGLDDPARASMALQPLLTDASPEVRAEAARALGEMALPGSVEPLAPLLRDADSTVRQHAAIALGRIGGVHALGVLTRAFDDAQGTPPDVRFQALLALAEADVDRGVACARAALAEDDVWIASEAAVMLGELLADAPDGAVRTGDEATRATAREALRARLDAGATGRLALAIAMALARLGDARGRERIVAFLHDERTIEASDDLAELRLEAIDRLGLVGGPEAIAVLTPLGARMLASTERDRARTALARAGDEPTRARLVAQLGSTRASSRRSAIAQVGAARVREAVPTLIAMLSREPDAAASIAMALGDIGGPEARAALEELVRTTHDEDARVSAREALGRA